MYRRTATKLLALLNAVAFVLAEDPTRLNCDFTSECCWSGSDWIVRNDPVNINEFRRTFLVGRSKPPPDGAYLMYAGKRSGVIYRSCQLCSQDGKVTVQFRHWQSPTSRLRICWQVANTNVINDCVQIYASQQSTVIKEMFNVTKGLEIELMFMADNTDSENVAVAMLDRIRVDYANCGANILGHSSEIDEIAVDPSPVAFETAVERTRGISSPVSPVISKAKKSKTKRGKKPLMVHTNTANTQVAGGIRKIDTTQVEVVERTAAIQKPFISPLRAVTLPPPVPPPMRPILPIPEPTPVEIKPRLPVVSGSPVLPNPTVAVNSKPKDTSNPLHDLLGEDFANFLDPNYVTKEDDDEESAKGVKASEAVQRVKPKQNIRTSELSNSGEKIHKKVVVEQVVATATLFPTRPMPVKPKDPFHELHRPLHLGPIPLCETKGGCLFNHGFCSWTSPPQIFLNHRFSMTRVGQSDFVQASVSAGNVSAIETQTNMNEAHTIYFDYLKWQQPTRLVGCCSVSGQSDLHCPFASSQIASEVIWQTSNFECPAKTEKLVFICENYGSAAEGGCALDNIRLHKAFDIFLVEPCQKNSLNSM